MKKLFLILIFLIFNFSYAVTLDELDVPKSFQTRFGIGDNIEEIKEVKSKSKKIEKVNTEKDISAYDITYSDISIKKLALDVLDETEEEKEKMLEDLSNMWVSVASNSETMQYTLYKLSNPDENKPDENMLKKIIKPIASFSTIAGTTFSANPFVASGALIGGNIVNALTSDNKEANYQFTKVNDADMVILVRKIDDLQKKLLSLYIDYITKKKTYEMAVDNTKKREEYFKNIQNGTKEEIIVADTYLRNAQKFENKAKNEYFASKNVLENLVGFEVIEKIDK